MNPTPGDVHVNRILTDISIAFFQEARSFVATQVFPNVPVLKQSDLFPVWNRGDFNRAEMQKRAPGTESKGGGFRFTTTPYFANVWALHKDIDDQMRANADSFIAPDRNATNYLVNQALIRREKEWVSQFFGTGIWGTSVTPATLWSDAASTPLEDIEVGRQTIIGATGYMPNVLVLGTEVWSKLKNHPDIIDRVRGGATSGDPARVSMQAFANLVEVDRVVVSNAIETNSLEGATVVNAFIAGKHALLAYAAQSPGLETPSAGYTFSWTGYTGAGAEGQRIKSFRMEELAADRVEIEMAFAFQKIAAELGYFFNSVVA